MIPCLINLVIWIIFALVFVIVLEAIIRHFIPSAMEVLWAVRLLIGLILLLMILQCLLGLGYLPHLGHLG